MKQTFRVLLYSYLIVTTVNAQKLVTEKEVKKLYLPEVLKKMSEFTKAGKDCWDWIES